MSYAFWSLVGQAHQIGLARAQLTQMAGIHGHLAQQAMMQQQQAALAQVLFEAEQAARDAHALAPHDPFAAGVIARIKLNAVSGVGVGMFHTIESKRAWGGACEALDAHWRAVAAHPSDGPLAHRVLGAIDTLLRLRAAASDNPSAHLAVLESTAKQDEKAFRQITNALGVAFGLALLLSIGHSLYMGALPSLGLQDAGAAALMRLGYILAWLAVPILGIMTLTRRGEMVASRARAVQFAPLAAEFNAFLAHPDGGQLLEQVAARHPRLAA